jgi:hypothetical protein
VSTGSAEAFRREPDQYEPDLVFDTDAPSEHAPVAQAPDPRLASVLLGALAAMAARNRRGEADLYAALRGAGLTIDGARLEAALDYLRAEGCVTNLVLLSDGDLLMKVTGVKPSEY